MSDIPEYQYDVVEWKDPDRKELLFQSESFDDLIQACNFMHHTLHKQKGYTEIRRIENLVLEIVGGESNIDLEDTYQLSLARLLAQFEKKGETSH